MVAALASISLEVFMAIGSVTRLDLQAHRLIRDWEWSFPVTTTRKVQPCPRPLCGGSILQLGLGDPRCLLCAREDGQDTEEDVRREVELVELMTA